MFQPGNAISARRMPAHGMVEWVSRHEWEEFEPPRRQVRQVKMMKNTGGRTGK
jgi:hypothetical protein